MIATVFVITTDLPHMVRSNGRDQGERVGELAETWGWS
jgi:hypothetical protein